jgi:hypothetical protein
MNLWLEGKRKTTKGRVNRSNRQKKDSKRNDCMQKERNLKGKEIYS